MNNGKNIDFRLNKDIVTKKNMKQIDLSKVEEITVKAIVDEVNEHGIYGVATCLIAAFQELEEPTMSGEWFPSMSAEWFITLLIGKLNLLRKELS